MINIIVAIAQTDKGMLMGVDNKLPWHDRKDKFSKKDMAWFKDCTWGDTVIMGRKTWESMGSKPLKNRRNIVVSSTLHISGDSMRRISQSIAFKTLSEAVEDVCEQWGPDEYGLDKDDSTIWIIGGASLYKEAMTIADRIYLTHFPIYEVEGNYNVKHIDYIKDSKEQVYFPEIPNTFKVDYTVDLISHPGPVADGYGQGLMVEVYKKV